MYEYSDHCCDSDEASIDPLFLFFPQCARRRRRAFIQLVCEFQRSLEGFEAATTTFAFRLCIFTLIYLRTTETTETTETRN